MCSAREKTVFNILNSVKLTSIILLFISIVFTANALDLYKETDNATILGKVFKDTNNNGIQDANEYGIPGVRLSTVSGLTIETDGYGRYHIPDNVINISRNARSYILKIDKASLPVGSVIQSENPRVIRLSNASVNKINFAINY